MANRFNVGEAIRFRQDGLIGEGVIEKVRGQYYVRVYRSNHPSYLHSCGGYFESKCGWYVSDYCADPVETCKTDISPDTLMEVLNAEV